MIKLPVFRKKCLNIIVEVAILLQLRASGILSPNMNQDIKLSCSCL